MPTSPHPTPELLEAIASGREVDNFVRAHVDRCAECQALLARIRANNDFLAGVFNIVSTDGREDPAVDEDTEIPGYRILSKLSEGGQGEVFKALQIHTGRIVALKILSDALFATEKKRRRFDREVEIAASLDHPNIVTVFDAVPPRAGLRAFAMALVDGVPLDVWKPVEESKKHAAEVPSTPSPPPPPPEASPSELAAPGKPQDGTEAIVQTGAPTEQAPAAHASTSAPTSEQALPLSAASGPHEDSTADSAQTIRFLATNIDPHAPTRDGGASETGLSPDSARMKRRRGGPLPTTAAALAARLELFAKVCDAVHYAHQRGIIHRDIKPSNILADEVGNPHVLDFGIAIAVSDIASRSGEAGQPSRGFTGTVAFASPEQARGDLDQLDTRTDIYSLGVVLFLMLTARLPYELDGETATRMHIIETTPPAHPSSFNAALAGDLDAIILKALAKDPSGRYQTAAEFGADLRRVVRGEAVLARRGERLYNARKWARGRWKTLAVTATVVAVAGGGVWMRVENQARLAAEQLASERERAEVLTSVIESMAPVQGRALSPMQRKALGDQIDTISSTMAEREAFGSAIVQARVRYVLGNTLYHLGRLEPARREFSYASLISKQMATRNARLESDINAGLADVESARSAWRAYTQVIAEKAGATKVADAALAALRTGIEFESTSTSQLVERARLMSADEEVAAETRVKLLAACVVPLLAKNFLADAQRVSDDASRIAASLSAPDPSVTVAIKLAAARVSRAGGAISDAYDHCRAALKACAKDLAARGEIVIAKSRNEDELVY